MMRRFVSKFWRNSDGAVAPTIAMSLVGVIAAGGIAFDYARLAGMDTELQSAADQAALAAATQLDGQAGAQTRARSAARTLIKNRTYFANDGSTVGIDIPAASIRFFRDYDPATGAKTGETTSDAESNYVLVTINTRRANYALTPIVAAVTSGNMAASAFATLDSAFCNLPPFMMCKPNSTFDAANHIGAGMRLIIDNPVAPGNFGFMQTGFGTGANALGMAIGWNGSAGGCVAARGAITEPGNKMSVRPAINTRFDISDGGQSCPAGGTCSPSRNTRKDLVHDNNCSTNGNGAWQESDNPYRGRADAQALSPSTPMNGTHTYPDVMGHPRDLCHAVSEAGTCGGLSNGIVGNGVWDRDAYFKVNYGWDSAATGGANAWTTKTGLSADPLATNYATRYKVYLWEAAHPLPDGASSPGIGNNQQVDVVKGKKTEKYYASSWTGPTPAPQRTCREPGVDPSNPDQDRRRTSVAVVDCGGLAGRKIVQPLQVIDVFLVEPVIKRPEAGGGSAVRTGDGDLYVEIIGTRPLPGVNQNSGNIIRRDVPRLIE